MFFVELLDVKIHVLHLVVGQNIGTLPGVPGTPGVPGGPGGRTTGTINVLM